MIAKDGKVTPLWENMLIWWAIGSCAFTGYHYAWFLVGWRGDIKVRDIGAVMLTCILLSVITWVWDVLVNGKERDAKETAEIFE